MSTYIIRDFGFKCTQKMQDQLVMTSANRHAVPMSQVILCDETGTPIGTQEVVEAHTGDGALHRAFSIFVFRDGGNELLIQQRSSEKMLFPNLWANTCCSHPVEGEELLERAQQRLTEELGFSCDLSEGPSFVYKAEDPNGSGTEHEFDTVITGFLEEDVTIAANPDEVQDYRWITLDELMEELDDKPEEFAPWFPIALGVLFDGS